MHFTLHIGSLAPKLKEQLSVFGLDDKEIDHWQKDVDSCNRLRIRGMLARSESRKCEQRIFKKICKEVEKSDVFKKEA